MFPKFLSSISFPVLIKPNQISLYLRRSRSTCPFLSCRTPTSSLKLVPRISSQSSIYASKFYSAQVQGKTAPEGASPPSSSGDATKRNILLVLGILFGSGVAYKVYVDSSDKDSGSLSSDVKKKRLAKIVVPPKKPATSDKIPSEIPYLLVGGGTASFSAFRAIKSIEPKAKVLIISHEPFNPYMRPPLSKEMFYVEDRDSAEKLLFKQWNGTIRSLFYEPDEFYTPCEELQTTENGGVSIAQGWAVKDLDVEKQTVTLDDGKLIKYDKCLIATGAKPKNIPVFEKCKEEIKDRVILYRGINEFKQLESIISEGSKTIAIVGGGFLGSELSCALARRGKNHQVKVTQIFKEGGIMGKVLPQYLSDWTTEKVKNEGVEVLPSSKVDDVDLVGDSLKLKLSNGDSVNADYVIVAVGVEPNTELAKAGLEVDESLGGYLVNAELQARNNVYVAGDCACFYDVQLGRRRVEHHDHAVVSGRLAGENMAGSGKPYWHQSMFWSDIGPDVGYEAIGIIDSSLPTVGVFAKGGQSAEDQNEDSTNRKTNDFTKGAVFYLKDDVIVGILLWNLFNKISIARQVLKSGNKFEDVNEVAKHFNIHSS